MPHVLCLLLLNGCHSFCIGLGNTYSLTKFSLVCQGKTAVTFGFKFSTLSFPTQISVWLSYNGFFLGTLPGKDMLFISALFTAQWNQEEVGFFPHQLQTALDKQCIFKEWFGDIWKSYWLLGFIWLRPIYRFEHLGLSHWFFWQVSFINCCRVSAPHVKPYALALAYFSVLC